MIVYFQVLQMIQTEGYIPRLVKKYQERTGSQRDCTIQDIILCVLQIRNFTDIIR